MAATFATPVKSYTWRISAIPRGTTRETLVDFFDIRDRERIEIRSLCPDVLDPEWLTATVLFKPPPGLPEAQPELDSNAPPDIEVDKDFEGFTPLYSPPGGQMIEADIIAVTGFAGHAFGSWARSETFMWLLDLAPRFASSSRILTYGYDIGLLGGRSSAATVTDEAAAFLDHLLNIRDEIEGDRPIIFVGHSLGCLIIKKAMMDAYYRQVPSTRLPVQAAIFLAAPHQGMNIEALRTVVKGEPPQALVEELTPGSQVLNDLNNRFMTVAKEVEFLTVFEGMRSPKAQQVARGVWTRSGPEISIVDEQSMKQYWASEIKICANRDDHFSIAKLRKQSQNKVVLAVMKSLRRAVFPAGGISRVNTLRTIDETTQITRTNTLKSIDETDSSGTIGSPGPQWQPTLNSALSWQNRPPSAPVSVPGSFDLESRAPTFVHSRADRSERVGLGVCSACNTDISSHEYFYQCTDCKSEYTCRKCQNSPVCHLHGKPSSKQQFVWYGDRQDVNIWIDPKPVSWDTPFVRAVKQEDLERLSALGREPEALNALDSDGLSPLHIAAHLNLENSARWLIAHGANQQVQTRKGRTPLSQAVYSNHIGMIKLLMAGGVNLKPERTSPLHRACQIGSREIVEVLLKGVDSVDIKDSEGRTALWTSCKSREFDLAELLLEAGADPNTKMKDDAATLLGSVAADNNMEAVRLLLNHNADPENLDSQQRSALFRAAEMGNDEACRALLEKGAKTQTQAKDTEGTQTILGRVASMGKLSTVRLLLESGDDIEGLDGQKRTPFARAAVAGHLLVCNYLLSMGANADPQAGYPHQSPSGNSWRWPLLHAVTVKGNAAIVQLLLENKVDLEENDTHRWTPLMTAAYGGNLELCKLFVKSGANVNHHESLISNVLTKAAHGGHLEVVKFLLASGASAKPTNGKWKNLDFHPGVAPEVKAAILQELRAKKKAQP